ncbi:hypothetical protein [Actinophytocola oryzae]|uniref:Secreted protein n=1 Tax=Actinophytocola oryzae TaxID=502181 RepID=A0A4V3FV34_9PSEU|nr:hypothetical protein [Actinophytocola oryzae]TDV57561.1 hypothetical protein CLV71_101432 [Actinophytocola oryzae]
MTSTLSRRVFIGAVAAAGAAVMAGTAAAAPTLSRAAGAARLGDTVYVLGRSGARWVLVDPATGESRATQGLEKADVLDLSATGERLVAVGATGTAPTVWESSDGLRWSRAATLDGDGHLTAVEGTLAVGALLTLERAPHTRIVARRTGNTWKTVATTGLEDTNQVTATAVGHDGEWLLSTVDATGATIHRSPDGLAWTAKETHTDTAIKAFDSAKWVANSMSGTEGPTRRAARAQAVGVVGSQSYWLVDGTLVTATI